MCDSLIKSNNCKKAKTELEKAKKEVEAMILGDDYSTFHNREER
ncbi:MAG: hypothetical protein ACRC6M_04940 [Microcystaceae cyanobacterium]